jgi:hypothetical protein
MHATVAEALMPAMTIGTDIAMTIAAMNADAHALHELDTEMIAKSAVAHVVVLQETTRIVAHAHPFANQHQS